MKERTITIHLKGLQEFWEFKATCMDYKVRAKYIFDLKLFSDVPLSMLVELPEVMIDVMEVEIEVVIGTILHSVVDEEEETSKTISAA